MQFPAQMYFPPNFFNFPTFVPYPYLETAPNYQNYQQCSSFMSPTEINSKKNHSNTELASSNHNHTPVSDDQNIIKPKALKKRAARKKKDENYGWRNQNKDRNLISVILKEYP